MFDHIGFAVSNLAEGRKFFLAALAPLGVSVAMEGAFGVGLGKAGKPSLWLHEADPPAGPIS